MTANECRTSARFQFAFETRRPSVKLNSFGHTVATKAEAAVNVLFILIEGRAVSLISTFSLEQKVLIFGFQSVQPEMAKFCRFWVI